MCNVDMTERGAISGFLSSVNVAMGDDESLLPTLLDAVRNLLSNGVRLVVPNSDDHTLTRYCQ